MLKHIFLAASLVIFMMPFAKSHSMSEIYVSPTGNDSNDGAAETPLRSLQKALDIAYAQSADSNIDVRIGNGIYMGQSAIVNLKEDIPRVTIVGELKDGKRPIFAKGKKNRYWLRINANRGQETKLSIKNLEIRDYFAALLLFGNRDNIKMGNYGSHIENNIFRRIGSTPQTSTGALSTGVLILANSSKNIVINNQFLDIENATGCGALHALYIAHFSSKNKISNNLFKNTCGSPVKLRDRSNENLVSDNRFEEIIGVPSIQEWFCDKDFKKNYCTKKLGECPSTGNIIRNNAFMGSDDRGSASGNNVQIFGKDIPRSWCMKSQFSSPRFLN